MTRRDSPREEPPDFESAFRFAERVMEHWDAYPDRFTSTSMTGPVVADLVRPRRQRLLRAIRARNRGATLEVLAAELQRTPLAVSRDARLLTNLGLAEWVEASGGRRLRATGRPLILY